jgi:ATP-binding cassette subfamily B protein
MKIELPCLKQEHDYSCVPACIRIVLRHHGVDLPEARICSVCQTTPRGTDQQGAAQGIISLGFQAIKLKAAKLDDIIQFLRQNQPVIAVLGVEHLPYGGQYETHAVVINGLGRNQISFIDPARGEEIEISLKTFLKAWQARRCLGLVIES